MTLTSLVSYPNRGEGGRSDFRGNCSPRLVQDLIEHYKPRLFYDPAIGSGTSRDVAQSMKVPGFFSDLAQGYNVLVDEPPYSGFDMAFWHPPYWNIIQYSGPGGQWGGAGNAGDLSLIQDYGEFIKALNEATFRIYETLKRGGRLAVLVGDVRRKGTLYPIQRDMRWYGTPDAFVVKAQHNMVSNRTSYSGSGNFVAIVTEYLIVTKKADAWIVPLRVTEPKQMDTRRWAGATWQSLVYAGLENLGGEADLPALYECLQEHRRVQESSANGVDWQAIVRRELQTRPHFRNIERGRWCLVQPA